MGFVWPLSLDLGCPVCRVSEALLESDNSRFAAPTSSVSHPAYLTAAAFHRIHCSVKVDPGHLSTSCQRHSGAAVSLPFVASVLGSGTGL